ncbi:hypothetical protein P8452_50750 [Trifolium repens]|nr:hypothetical protein P8452_50750 [Trifolium repens]
MFDCVTGTITSLENASLVALIKVGSIRVIQMTPLNLLSPQGVIPNLSSILRLTYLGRSYNQFTRPILLYKLADNMTTVYVNS